MNKIKFSGDYPKLHHQTKAILVNVIDLTVPDDLNEELREFDTRKRDGTRYELAPGAYIELVFFGNLRIPFTTIRPASPAIPGRSLGKKDYYLSKIGCMFEIVIEEGGKQ